MYALLDLCVIGSQEPEKDLGHLKYTRDRMYVILMWGRGYILSLPN